MCIRDRVEQQAQEEGIQNQVEVDFNAQYVLITLNGALLFDSGSADIREDAYPLVDKISNILSQYDKNMIDIEGHTDNVPIHNQKYEDNDVLSMYRALTCLLYTSHNRRWRRCDRRYFEYGRPRNRKAYHGISRNRAA